MEEPCNHGRIDDCDECRDFAAAFLAGQATDSLGNRQGDTKFSLLGPQPPVTPSCRTSTTSHMNPALVGSEDALDTRHNPLESDDFHELWHPGFNERRKEMYASAGVRQPSESERKQVVDRAVIMAAFRKGYSR